MTRKSNAVVSARRSTETDHSAQARVALIRAAERCIAEHGLAGAPLKAIHLAAGQRNTSATQYHFGSRDGLIIAAIENRMPILDAHRSVLLDAEIERHGPLPPLRNIVAAWIGPLADQLQPHPEGNFYLRFVDHLRHEAAELFASRIVTLQPGYARIFALLEQHLDFLPSRVIQSRIALAAEQLISSLARLEADLERAPRRKTMFPALAVALLADYISSGLAAPLSEASAALLEEESTIGFHLNFYPLASPLPDG